MATVIFSPLLNLKWVKIKLDFHQDHLSKVLYEDRMIYLPEFGADKSVCISSDSRFPTHLVDSF